MNKIVARKSFYSFFIHLALFMLTLAVGLCLAEVALRVKNNSMKNYDIEMWRYAKELKRRSADIILSHEHVPGSESILQSVLIRINERGMRGGTLPAEGAEKRILFLGSSITLGWGVEEDLITTSILEKKFKANNENVEVLNAGVGNYNAKRYIHLFLSQLSDLKPTDIVVHYFINDAEVLSHGGGNALVKNSQLAATVVTAYNRLTIPSGIESLVEHYKHVYSEESPGHQDMVASFELLADYARSNPVHIFILMTPDIHQLVNYPFYFIHKKMQALAERYGFVFVDPIESFLKMEPSELWAMPGDPHPNAVGHELMADAIYDVIKSSKH